MLPHFEKMFSFEGARSEKAYKFDLFKNVKTKIFIFEYLKKKVKKF